MRTAVLARDGVLHYALLSPLTSRQGRCFYIFCDPSNTRRTKYYDDDIQEDLPTCVRCLGEELLRGKNLEPLDVD